jgi:hypothetical protein
MKMIGTHVMIQFSTWYQATASVLVMRVSMPG